MSEDAPERCPRCGLGRLRGWQELDEEERMVVRRLPASAAHDPTQRRARHRWCTRCWYEAQGDAELEA